MNEKVSRIDTSDIDKVTQLLKGCQSILFVTGAGISADSGLPTYRGIGGLYNVETTEDGMSIEVALSGSTMENTPELTWKYLKQIELACRGAKFNRAHEVIAAMEERFKRVWTLTQNVDGVHQAAGCNNVIDIHGNLHHLKCMSCNYRETVPDFSRLSIVPQCPNCNAVVRPDVVLFGEILPAEKVRLLQHELDQGFDLVFSIGTTSLFPYINEPIYRAKNAGSPTVEINPGVTEVSNIVDVKIPLKAAMALDNIWRAYQE